HPPGRAADRGPGVGARHQPGRGARAGDAHPGGDQAAGRAGRGRRAGRLPVLAGRVVRHRRLDRDGRRLDRALTEERLVAATGLQFDAEASRRVGAAYLTPDGGELHRAVSAQVVGYLDDVPAALAAVHRVLRPGGRVLLLDTDWDSIVWHSGDEERMARVLGAWEQHLVDPRLPRKLRGLLERAGFEVAPPRIVPLFNAGFDPASFSVGLVQLVA